MSVVYFINSVFLDDDCREQIFSYSILDSKLPVSLACLFWLVDLPILSILMPFSLVACVIDCSVCH